MSEVEIKQLVPKEVKTLCAESAYELDRQLNHALSEGWCPFGSLIITPRHPGYLQFIFAQQVAKYHARLYTGPI